MSTASDFLPLAQYAERRRSLFPSQSGLTWFVRQHRAQLVANGAMLMVAGRRVVDPARFDEVVVAVGSAAIAKEPA